MFTVFMLVLLAGVISGFSSGFLFAYLKWGRSEEMSKQDSGTSDTCCKD